MQPPPPGEPTPSFGQPPYAAPPPPPRGRTSPFMYCLGCMGVLTVIVIIIGIISYVGVKKVMSPITAADVQKILPPGVPLYPGLSAVVEEQSRTIQLPAKGGNHKASVLAFHTNEPMSVIGPWYETRLKQQGWAGGVSAKDANAYEFKKGDTALSLNERPDGNGRQLLMISVLVGLPEGSLGTSNTSP